LEGEAWDDQESWSRLFLKETDASLGRKKEEEKKVSNCGAQLQCRDTAKIPIKGPWDNY